MRSLEGYDAVVIGSAVYALRWRPEALRFLKRFRTDLAATPVWIFQSGPLDDSATEREIPLPRKAARLAAAAGADRHVTFGGCLRPAAEGFLAEKMAKSGSAGDWRDFGRIESFAGGIAAALPHAPGYTASAG